jgi:hypothetical protein
MLIEGERVGDVKTMENGHDFFSRKEDFDDRSDDREYSIAENKNIRTEHEETCLEKSEGEKPGERCLPMTIDDELRLGEFRKPLRESGILIFDAAGNGRKSP